jgi:membrane-bound lytic murein transglycosylase D
MKSEKVLVFQTIRLTPPNRSRYHAPVMPPSVLRLLVLLTAALAAPAFAQQAPAPVAQESMRVPAPMQVAGPVVAAPLGPAPKTTAEVFRSSDNDGNAHNNVPGDAPATAAMDVRSLDWPPDAKMLDLTAEPDDLWERMRVGFGMQDLTGPLVVARQNWYAARPTMLKTLFARSKRYLYHIVAELEKRGMPTELALLPMVESAFNPMAYSRAHASGLWQFIPSTGKRYELAQNSWYDGRRDVLASTTAALDYLQFLYDMHGDWHLALASYNWGENAVGRAMEKNRAKGLPTNYMALTMPSETRNYVPKLQALKNIIANPGAFGIDIDPIPNQPYFVTVPKTPDIDIKLAARLAEMPVAELVALNPAYNRPVMAAAQSAVLVLPANKAQVFLSNLENHDEPLTSWKTHTLRPGERLDKLAAAHGISLAKLKQANAISPRTPVAPGFQLLLPVKGSGAALEPLPVGFSPPAIPERGARTVVRKTVHTVQRGETLASIAQRYKVGMDDLKRWNTVGRLFAGQKLSIERETAVSSGPVRKPAPRKRTTRVVKTRG